jgi:hypothetical protein
MSIEKRIEVCIGTSRSKDVRVRLSLLIVDGGAVLAENFHSIAIMPGDDAVSIRAAIEAHLANPDGGIPGAPWPAIPDAEWADVEAHCGIVHKPAVVAAYQARIEALKGNK